MLYYLVKHNTITVCKNAYVGEMQQWNTGAEITGLEVMCIQSRAVGFYGTSEEAVATVYQV